MSKNVTHLTDDNYGESIKSGVVLIDFWATWCQPCLMQAPILDKVANHFVGKALIAKIDVDDNSAAANAYGISSIPTLILFKNGKEIKRFVGVQQETSLIKAIDILLT